MREDVFRASFEFYLKSDEYRPGVLDSEMFTHIEWLEQTKPWDKYTAEQVMQSIKADIKLKFEFRGKAEKIKK